MWRKISRPCRSLIASYRNGWVFRNEKPGPGRFRQFMQFDADTVGAPNVSADAEMCMMMADTLERLGIQRGDYAIRANNRKVLDGVLDAIGLEGEGNAAKRLNVLRAIDKLDKFGPEGVRLLLGKGRLDESGDFTKGAQLPEAAIERFWPSPLPVARMGRKPSPIFKRLWQAMPRVRKACRNWPTCRRCSSLVVMKAG